MATTFSLDGVDASTLGFYIDPIATDGWLDASDLSFSAVGSPGRSGGVVSSIGVGSPRTLVVSGRILPSTYGAANRETAERAFKDYHGREARLRIDDGSTGKEIVGRLVRIKVKPKNWPTPQVSQCDLTFLCEEGSWRSLTPFTLALSSTRRTITLGNAKVSDWVIQVQAATNPVITIRDAGGKVLHTLTYTGTIGASEYVEWNGADGTILRYSSGTATSVVPDCTGGLPTLDPFPGLTIELASDDDDGALAMSDDMQNPGGSAINFTTHAPSHPGTTGATAWEHTGSASLYQLESTDMMRRVSNGFTHRPIRLDADLTDDNLELTLDVWRLGVGTTASVGVAFRVSDEAIGTYTDHSFDYCEVGTQNTGGGITIGQVNAAGVHSSISAALLTPPNPTEFALPVLSGRRVRVVVSGLLVTVYVSDYGTGANETLYCSGTLPVDGRASDRKRVGLKAPGATNVAGSFCAAYFGYTDFSTQPGGVLLSPVRYE